MPAAQELLVQATENYRQARGVPNVAGQHLLRAEAFRGTREALEAVMAEVGATAHLAAGFEEDARARYARYQGQDFAEAFRRSVGASRAFAAAAEVPGAPAALVAEARGNMYMSRGMASFYRGEGADKNGTPGEAATSFGRSKQAFEKAAAVAGAPASVTGVAPANAHQSRGYEADARGRDAMTRRQYGAAAEFFDEAQRAFAAASGGRGPVDFIARNRALMHLSRGKAARERGQAAVKRQGYADAATFFGEAQRAFEAAAAVADAPDWLTAAARTSAHESHGRGADVRGEVAAGRGQLDAAAACFEESRLAYSAVAERGGDPGSVAEAQTRMHRASGAAADAQGRAASIKGEHAEAATFFGAARQACEAAAAVAGAPGWLTAPAMAIAQHLHGEEASARGRDAVTRGQHGAAAECFDEAQSAFAASAAGLGNGNPKFIVGAKARTREAVGSAADARGRAAFDKGDHAGAVTHFGIAVRAYEDVAGMEGVAPEYVARALQLKNKVQEFSRSGLGAAAIEAMQRDAGPGGEPPLSSTKSAGSLNGTRGVDAALPPTPAADEQQLGSTSANQKRGREWESAAGHDTPEATPAKQSRTGSSPRVVTPPVSPNRSRGIGR